MNVLSEDSRAFEVNGIRRDESTGLFWCALCCISNVDTQDNAPHACSTSPPFVIGYMSADVRRHLGSSEHVGNVEVSELAVEEFCLVEINGIRMALDHHVVFPAAMFGAGRTLYDETVGCLLTVDACGGITLFSQHRYTVVELMLPLREAAPPAGFRVRWKHFDRWRHRARRRDRKTPACESRLFLEEFNARICGETMHRQRRRKHFTRGAAAIAKKEAKKKAAEKALPCL